MKNPNEIPKMKTMVSSLNSFIEKGYTEDYKVSCFGLKALKTEKYYQPSQVKVLDFHRFEGQTDPADEAILFAIETDDGLKGTLVDAYGTYSDTKVTAFMQMVEEISKDSIK
jgi:hypothetical protein